MIVIGYHDDQSSIGALSAVTTGIASRTILSKAGSVGATLGLRPKDRAIAELFKHFSRLIVIVGLISFDLAAQVTYSYRIEHTPVAGSAEMITLVAARQRGSTDASRIDVPLLAALRDTLGDRDPDNDRLRYVWLLTNSHPNLLQRVTSAIPFAFLRTETKQQANHVPKPTLDLASPARDVWTNLLADGMQVLELDPMGTLVRSTTRSYRENSKEYHELQTFRILNGLSNLLEEPETQQLSNSADLRLIYSRLSLSNRLLGGTVREESLSEFYYKEATERYEIRAHNWELLRQRAELCDLYFEPIALDGRAPRAALLWIARSDLDDGTIHRFNPQFLNISNPWTDRRLLNWTGYSQLRYLDSENRPVAPETPGAHSVELIPLAFYSLEYQRVPLLLVDFRNRFRAKRSELAARAASTLLTGVLGLTGWGNWSFLAAKSAWTFVRARHGAPVNRDARLRARADARELLEVSSVLDPALKAELLNQLNHLALNPLENSLENETTIAQEQYSALVRYASSPEGLAAKLYRDRQRELWSYTHSNKMRLLVRASHLLGRGPELHVDEPSLLALLDSYRRAEHHVGILQAVLSSGQVPEVGRDPDEIRRVIDALAFEPATGPNAARLIARVLKRTQDPRIRIACVRALSDSDLLNARAELEGLSHDPDAAESLRELCLAYLQGAPDGQISAETGTR